MGLLKTSEELDRLLNHENNGINKVPKIVEPEIVNTPIIKVPGSGKHGNGGAKLGGERRTLTIEDKSQIGLIAEVLGNEMAGALTDTNASSVSNYKNGRNASGVPEDEALRLKEQKVNKLADKLFNKVDVLMEMISDEAIVAEGALKGITSAEKIMNMFDKLKTASDKRLDERRNFQGVILYAPKQINISNYEKKEV